MYSKNNILFASIITLALFSACKREYDSPPKREIPEGYILTIDSLRKLYKGTSIKFSDDYSVFATVTADETDGNLYKNVFVQDGTGAINLRLVSSGGMYKGDYVRISLKGAVLSSYNKMLQLDSVDVNKNIVKQDVLKDFAPTVISDISKIDKSYESKLLRLDNVEVAVSDTNKTWAKASTQQSDNVTIKDCKGNSIIVRTSGYANYANTKVPKGNGSMVLVLSYFNDTPQLYLRSLGEVQMNSTRCGGGTVVTPPTYPSKNFDDNSLTSGGWTLKQVAGATSWTVEIFSGNGYAKAAAFSSGDSKCETWLISPSFDLSTSTNPILYFKSAQKYNGPDIEVYVLKNYDGTSDPNASDKTALTATLSTGNFTWTNSGDISLSSFKTNDVRIGFKYSGTTSTARTWELDGIVVKEK
jgi:hypothetical protein